MRAAQPGVEYRLRQRRTKRPVTARQRKQLRQHRALEATGCRQRERGKERRLGDTDLSVGRRRAPFCGGDIRTTLEQFGRQSRRYRWKLGGHGFGGDRKVRGRFAKKNSDCVLELRALDAGIDGLRLGGLELRFGLGDIGTRRNADGILVARQLQRSLISLHGVVEQTDLRVLNTEQKIILGEKRLRRQLRRFEVRDAGLRRGFAGFNRSPDAAPEVDLPTHVQRDVVAVAGASALAGCVADANAGPAAAAASRCTGACAD